MSQFKLFEYLNKHIKKDFTHSAMYSYVVKKFEDYLKIDSNEIKRFLQLDSSFDLLRSYIIIRSFENKKLIENNTDLDYELAHKDLPYINIDNKGKIFVPIFDENDNKLYDKDYQTLNYQINDKFKKDFLNHIINPFSTYNTKLFSSNFISLIKIKEHDNLIAYYSQEFKTIYIITEQGTLSQSIPIYENENNDPLDVTISKIIISLDFYFLYKREKFISSLLQNKFISEKTYKYISKKSQKKFNKKGKRTAKAFLKNYKKDN